MRNVFTPDQVPSGSQRATCKLMLPATANIPRVAHDVHAHKRARVFACVRARDSYVRTWVSDTSQLRIQFRRIASRVHACRPNLSDSE